MNLNNKDHRALALLLIILVAALALAIVNYITPYASVLKVNGHELEVVLANTPNKRFQGLSDRDSLVGYDGMFFPFEYLGEHSMVMRRMHFPLDMVWINDSTVVQVLENLPPEPDRKETELTVYSNTSTPATSVLELPAGGARKYDIKVGDTVEYGKRKLFGN